MIAPALHIIYRGLGVGDPPVDVTHVTTHESVTVIPAELFEEIDWPGVYPHFIELICHENVKKIGRGAFYEYGLIRVVMPGVEEVEEGAFEDSILPAVECPKLEIIGERAFAICMSLSGINLPSARIVGVEAFCGCDIENVTFGPSLESIGRWAFLSCRSLKQITIPLKNGLFRFDDTFKECNNLMRVNLVDGEVLNVTVNALLRDEWRNEMRTVIDSIDHNLPYAPAGDYDYDSGDDGEKTMVIRRWISLVLSKIIRYKAQHRGLLIEAEALLLSLELPDEIVMNNVLPFIELPSHTFDGEDNTVAI